MQKNNEVTGWQLFYLVIQTQIGVGVLSLPRDITLEAGHDAWISVILGGVLIQLVLLIFLWLLLRVGELSYFDIIIQSFGKAVGKVFIFCYLIYFLYILTVSSITFTKILSDWIYLDTPREILTILFLIPAAYCAGSKISHVARFSMIVSCLLPVLVILLIPVYSSPEFIHFFPIGSEGASAILGGLKASVLAYIGFEAFLYFSKYVKSNRQKELKKAAFSTSFVLFFYLFLVISTQLYFHVQEIVVVPYAVLYILKSLSFVIVERIDLIFLTLWIVVALTSFINYLYVAAEETKILFNLKGRQWAIMFMISSVFAVSLFIDEKQSIIQLQNLVTYAAAIFTVIIPLAALSVYLLFRKGHAT
ncbi:GerAB/ArcD/ProY family transporter [Jeotgalibacillus haloalkalitolerans]|uniref:GerAB/ArcD/ProY family transporter n=1 Tax=Jeotgalibacillus haloalkalitolerans TaxID=3104292 RepID=A0ABU5KID5_9BACL|nr:GerAB/ArcD/ProY family transporter [Jeotgalibacillus sp. HH7-29]MDZ5711009.1 GerAB/ArcD/ProY family transporter [Jeotgalibacillus sp. HH7-29]